MLQRPVRKRDNTRLSLDAETGGGTREVYDQANLETAEREVKRQNGGRDWERMTGARLSSLAMHISIDMTIMPSYTRATHASLGSLPRLFLGLAHRGGSAMPYTHILMVLTPPGMTHTRLPGHCRFLVRPQRLTRR
jgi:hypothetical protein